MDKKYTCLAMRRTTTSYRQTQKLGEKLAREILELPTRETAIILGLSGNLGGGKTTFLQGFAKGLGIKEKILSPTFVIMKKFKIPKHDHFYHFDCYRFDKPKDILELGWKEIISNSENIVAVEWPEKIKEVLPKNTIFINFNFIDKNKREISF